MSFSIISVVGENNEIGKQGGLCFALKSDLAFFKRQTMGHKMLMGSRTYNSLPKRLEGREYYVLCDKDREFLEWVNVVRDLDSFVKEWKDKDEEVFVIGGGFVYKQMLEHADKLILTEILASDKDADTFFPEFDLIDWNREIIEEGIDNGYEYKRVVYTKK